MISKAAISKYLKKNLDNWDWVKDLSREDLYDIMDSFDTDFTVKEGMEPFFHQLVMYCIGIDLGHFLFHAGVGSGKTGVGLNLIDYFKNKEGSRRALVCVPDNILISQWAKQSKDFSPDLEVFPLLGSSKERLRDIEKENPDVFVINYMGLVAMFKKKATEAQLIKNKKKKFYVDREAVKVFSEQFDLVIYDEIHKLQNWRSMTSEIAKIISESCAFKFGFTGTLFGRDLQDVFNQFLCIDGGRTFGKTLGLFRAAFFKEKINNWGGYEYSLQKKKIPTLNKFMKHRSICYEKNECNDLPGVFTIPKHFQMTKEAREYYNDAIEDAIESKMLGDIKKTENSYIRMREAISGYGSFKVEEEKEKRFIMFKENPKLEGLIGLIDELPQDEKLVVFYCYTKTGETIVERLKKEKVSHIWLRGGMKDKQGEFEKFLDGKAQVAIMNVASGGTGLDGMQEVCNYMIVYESTSDPKLFEQMLGRLDRTGQKYPVMLYLFQMEDTIDSKIEDAIKEGDDLFVAIMLKGVENV